MAHKWYDIAEKKLDTEDEIQISYLGKLDGEYGYLCLSKRKLLFVNQEGFFRKSYKLTLVIPYEEIGRISHEGRYKLNLIDVEGKKHDFVTSDLPESIIEKSLKDLISAGQSH